VPKRFAIAAAVAALMTNSALAAAPAARAAPVSTQVIAPEEGLDGQQLWNSTTSPVLLFIVVVAIGVGIALLVKTHDEPASP
jgi:hypothetical protein